MIIDNLFFNKESINITKGENKMEKSITIATLSIQNTEIIGNIAIRMVKIQLLQKKVYLKLLEKQFMQHIKFI